MKKVMLAGNNAFSRIILKDIIEKNGIKVISQTAYGTRIEELYMKYKPDAVFMNSFLEDMTGDIAVKRLIAFDPDAEIIMTADKEDKKIVMNSIRAGAKDFIICPVQGNIVVETLNKILG